ncbi:Ribosome-binding ATPase YchF [Candidatus Fokinia solitaria]|uniref:Ribosome-binding ATPase YchF n=1 Tax=Candidatus Fokinia solitaria TaxID=1802984 RepID=A0A2U8BR99_9RICK|nr:redox-regulated ATPase YchF [Candidatus Fokinia solitaria]AWD32864.1 Ribosome-binding ATPase YchF [Candidatus Fokinia solitaria]
MGVACGIVGLPNVGKSTLFNSVLGKEEAEAANYPFCTIEPNKGMVIAFDKRLEILADIEGSRNIIYSTVELVDIAGLVKGASKGEGLGNQFLGHIREVDAIAHVVRCFTDSETHHVDGSVDPQRDILVIQNELILSDLMSIEKRLLHSDKKNKAERESQITLLKLCQEHLLTNNIKGVMNLVNEENEKFFKELGLLSMKKQIYIANIGEEDVNKGGNEYSRIVEEIAISEHKRAVVLSAKLEATLALMNKEERQFFLENYGLEEGVVGRLGKALYDELDFITFFTVGPQEARAWKIKTGTTAPKAAGEIHSDFERGFIKANVCSYEDYCKYGGEQKAREQGKIRVEGKEYVVHDGDVMHFKFNV